MSEELSFKKRLAELNRVESSRSLLVLIKPTQTRIDERKIHQLETETSKGKGKGKGGGRGGEARSSEKETFLRHPDSNSDSTLYILHSPLHPLPSTFYLYLISHFISSHLYQKSPL